MVKSTNWRGLVIPIALVIMWWGLARTGFLNIQLIPSLDQVCQAFLTLIRRKVILQHLTISLQRVLAGFSLAGLVALPLGIILGWYPNFQPWFNPTLHFLRQIPPIALTPLFIMWFGIGESSKNAIIFYAAFFPILLNTQLGVAQVSHEYWEVAKLYQFSWFKSLMRLVLPGSAETIITGLRLGMGMSWRALVAAEMLAASSGLGYLIMTSRSLVRLDEMIAGIIIIGLVGIIIDVIFLWVEKLLPWTNVKLEGNGHETKHFST